MYVCLCSAVSDRKLRELVAAGARTVRELQARSGAGKSCGSCVRELCDLLGQNASTDCCGPDEASQPLVANGTRR